jgi:serine/threonine protein phosphatase PrpC
MRMEEILRDHGNGGDSLESKCRSLIEEARNAGGPDNITAVVVRAPGTAVWRDPTLRDTQPIE